jgi:hypothetical protein
VFLRRLALGISAVTLDVAKEGKGQEDEKEEGEPDEEVDDEDVELSLLGE